MAYGAFALFFNVDKIMTLILSYNEPTESEQASLGKYCSKTTQGDKTFSAGKENPAYKTTETDFTDDIKEEKKQQLDVKVRSRASTTASQVKEFLLL